jgi:hypothetical protein
MTRRVLIGLALTLGLTLSVAHAASLNVGSWHVWSGSQTLTKSTCTVTGTAGTVDTFVDQTSPGSTAGGQSTMFVASGAGQQMWVFVRFNLSTCAIPTTGGADTATLKLFIKSNPGSTRTLTVTPVLTTWAASLTWTQAQSLSYGSATTTFPVTTGGASASATVTLDADALIKNTSANFGWRISDAGASQDQIEFFASEGSSKPTLTINYEK